MDVWNLGFWWIGGVLGCGYFFFDLYVLCVCGVVMLLLVVCYCDDGSGMVYEGVFELFYKFGIEMVCWFVK